MQLFSTNYWKLLKPCTYGPDTWTYLLSEKMLAKPPAIEIIVNDSSWMTDVNSKMDTQISALDWVMKHVLGRFLIEGDKLGYWNMSPMPKPLQTGLEPHFFLFLSKRLTLKNLFRVKHLAFPKKQLRSKICTTKLSATFEIL